MKIEDTLNNCCNWSNESLLIELTKKVKELIEANNQQYSTNFTYCEK